MLVLTANKLVSAQQSKPFTLEDMLNKRIFASASVIGLQSMNDGLHYTALSRDYSRIEKFSYQTGEKVAEILDLSQHTEAEVKRIVGYEFSADEGRLLIQADYEQLYRHSFKANYFIYKIQEKVFAPLSENGMQQLATFSPDGTKIAFVRDNNLFVKDLDTNNEKQITNDGRFNEIINGAPDWVYEEEFGFSKAFDWSDDSKYLAFMRFDERNVKMFNMTMYQGQNPSLDENILYPSNSQFKYPKAGEDNSLVSVLVYNLETEESVNVDLGEETDQYIPRIYFTRDPSKLAVLRMNRLQNELEILNADASTGKTELLHKEINKYYIDESTFDNIRFLQDGKHFVITSERDGWNHLYLFDIQGKFVRQLTEGSFDVTSFYGYDPEKKLFYYQAAGISPLGREVYSVSLKGKTILLTKGRGTHSADFSNTFKYFIHRWSSAEDPTVIALCDAKGIKIRILEENNKLKERLAEYNPSLKKFFTFKTSEGNMLNGWVIYPPDFDSTRKYPLLMNQYSGPNSQQVLDRWGFGFDEYLANQGYIIMCVDPRGTGARGEAFRKVTYLQLGKYETIDQIEAGGFAASLPYVDASRIGIWGWSYGGYISSSCMVKGDGVYSLGIAVAPVTNWRYYDNIYTERFMRKPQNNPDGYDQNSPLFFADQLKGKLFLIHGTADDNVHVQNTLEFSERLVQAGKQFDQMLYTNRNHGIYGGNTRMHLYQMIEAYLNRNL
ncbi:MAG: S9 family peptidase [Lentimicrobium sp.]|nr:S9 family peptidase [Lentimicrobium sp.]